MNWLKDNCASVPFYRSTLGFLFADDCMNVLPLLGSDCFDLVFADPPFNLNKDYGTATNDSRTGADYLSWCEMWLKECIRVLKPGGSLFLYNLPKWNLPLGAYLSQHGMAFRHWIAIEVNTSFPIAGRLYPSHYGLLYYSKGKPKTFRRIRTPIQVCRHCGGELKDYGGHRKAMNSNGVTLKDVWTDIPPVRHRKYKSKGRKANALSTKILDRVIEMSTVPGELVLDPFGGSGTTYVVCERKGRRWVGCEINAADDIVGRLNSDHVHVHQNDDWVEP